VLAVEICIVIIDTGLAVTAGVVAVGFCIVIIDTGLAVAAGVA
jgi:hypothetical protein